MIGWLLLIVVYILGIFVTDEYMDMLAEMDDDKYELPLHYHYAIVLAWPLVTIYLKLFRPDRSE